LNSPLSDHDRDRCVTQKHLANARRQVQHIRASRRAEVLLSLFQVAGGAVFEVGLVATQSVLADAIRTRMKVRDKDAGVVTVLPADHLAARERIDSPESGPIRQGAVNPTGLQRGGSWKNGVSPYPPVWVKTDPLRFPRAQNKEGKSLEILSTFSDVNRDADAHAFGTLMRHVSVVGTEESPRSAPSLLPPGGRAGHSAQSPSSYSPDPFAAESSIEGR
jgi:hypothetical protein